MQDVLAGLNPAQSEAVTLTRGPVLVIAGAGTGKTRTLTHRIAYMIEREQVSPLSILAVTFTNKAAQEMKKRVEQLLDSGGVRTYVPWMGTFHSICARILRRDIHHLGLTSSFTIYDTEDQKSLMRELIGDMKIDDKRITPQGMLGYISGAKNELMGPKEFAQQANDYYSEIAAKLYPKYQHALQEHNAVDFDDLIMHTVTLFRTHEDVLDTYQEMWRYILVDEYQDTNHSQYTLIRLLAEKYRNICVVGDDWQGIYGWRGADIRNILNYTTDYPEAKTIKLEQNYRSTQTILDAAQNIIDKNRNRTEKKLFTDQGAGDKIQVVEVHNSMHEGEMITREVVKKGGSLSEFVVLYRTNAQSRSIEEAFLRAAIPYKIVGGVKFYDRKEIKDILAYIRLIVNPADKISLLRIINVPSRKIGKSVISQIKEYSAQRDVSFHVALEQYEEITSLTPQARAGLNHFTKLLADLRTEAQHSTASQIIEKVLEFADYKTYLLDGTPEGEDRFSNVLELCSVSKRFDELSPQESLHSFLEEVALISDLDQVNNEDNGVTLMTLHSAKGLEFDHVFMAGMEENLFPHARAQADPEALEEERRLCYVGITRARETVTMSTAKQRLLYGTVQVNAPSRFLNDIDPSLIDMSSTFSDFSGQDSSSSMTTIHEGYPARTKPVFPVNLTIYKDGDKVSHPSFGKGMVVNVRGDIVSVAFQQNGIKKFDARVAPMEKLV